MSEEADVQILDSEDREGVEKNVSETNAQETDATEVVISNVLLEQETTGNNDYGETQKTSEKIDIEDAQRIKSSENVTTEGDESTDILEPNEDEKLETESSKEIMAPEILNMNAPTEDKIVKLDEDDEKEDEKETEEYSTETSLDVSLSQKQLSELGLETGSMEQREDEVNVSELEFVSILHPDTTLIDITQIDPIIEVVSDYGIFGKGMYVFPPLTDPGLDNALYDSGVRAPVYDEVGVARYKDICKELDVAPIARFMDALGGDHVDLRYYGVDPRGVRAIAEALYLNRTVHKLDLQDNWLSNDAVYHLGEMLRENNAITYLNLSGCRIGPKGAARLKEGLTLTQCLKELDLSGNQLGDVGFEALSPAIMENYTITHLNLSNNELGVGTGTLLGSTMEENWSVEHLDVSHNFLYPKDGLKSMFLGMAKNKSVTYLNMSWNALSTKFAGKPIKYYLSHSDVIQHLDLSWNRLDGVAVKMIKNGASNSQTLLTLKLGNNPLVPDDADGFIKAFVGSSSPLRELDFENIWVNKDFLKTQTNVLKTQDLKITIGGVYSNYKIVGPDVKQLLFARANYEAQKPKSKKKKRDFGHFILKLEDQMVKREKFRGKIEDEKLKINEDLITELIKNFVGPKKRVDLKAMKEYYLKLYPNTTLPPPKEKKKKKKKKGKDKDDNIEQVVKEPDAPPPPPVIRRASPPKPPEQSKINLEVASQLLGSYASALGFIPSLSTAVLPPEQSKSIIKTASVAPM